MEIEDIYRAKDFDEDLVKRVTDKITSNKIVWLKTMLTEELGLNLSIVGNPIKGAVLCLPLLSWWILPILPYLLSKTVSYSSICIMDAIAISITSSFLIGAKSKVSEEKLGERRNRDVCFRNWNCVIRYGIGAELNNANLLNY